MKVYIQKLNNNYPDDWLFCAFLGAEKLGMEIINFEDINEVPYNQFVIAFIDDTIKYFKRTGVIVPKPLNIPDELKKYTNREILITTLETVIRNCSSFASPTFIKPNTILKGFPSGVIKNSNNLKVLFSDIKDLKQDALVSTVIPMDSEYRCFIYKNELLDLKHYQGAFELFPDIKTIKKMILDYKSSPIAYTLDVAISNNETVLVECNDAWCIGNYGLDCINYIKMLRDRWFEIIKKVDGKEIYKGKIEWNPKECRPVISDNWTQASDEEIRSWLKKTGNVDARLL